MASSIYEIGLKIIRINVDLKICSDKIHQLLSSRGFRQFDIDTEDFEIYTYAVVGCLVCVDAAIDNCDTAISKILSLENCNIKKDIQTICINIYGARGCLKSNFPEEYQALNRIITEIRNLLDKIFSTLEKIEDNITSNS